MPITVKRKDYPLTCKIKDIPLGTYFQIRENIYYKVSEDFYIGFNNCRGITAMNVSDARTDDCAIPIPEKDVDIHITF